MNVMQLAKKTQMFLESYLNKSIKIITQNDLAKIEAICLSDDIEIIKYLPNLTSLTLENAIITDKLLTIIASSNIQELILKNCCLEGNLKFYNDSLTKLTILNCFAENYDFLNTLKNLEYLSIYAPASEIAIDCAIIPKNVKTLRLEYCELTNSSCLKYLAMCSSISILGTVVESFDFLNHLPIQALFINKEYSKEIEKFISKKCKVYNNYNEFMFIPEDDFSYKQ